MIIGGSDSSGGAGIQADCRALSYLGITVATAVTAVTSQGLYGVDAIQYIEPDVVAKQIENAFDMYDVAAVKMGMLGKAEIVLAVAKALRAHERPHTVIDPVVASSSGTRLLSDEGISAMLAELLPMCTVLTPNTEELQRLAGLSGETEEKRIEAARKLLERGARSVLIKGGHLDGHPNDLLVMPDDPWPKSFQGHRVTTDHSRGTGCTLASLIAGQLSLGSSIADAVDLSKKDLEHALHFPVVPRRGRGYPVPSDKATREQRLGKVAGIYFVSDSTLNAMVTNAVGARLAADGGANVVQLRDKTLDLRSLVRTGELMRAAAHRRGAIFIMNDRVDAALACDADGVHLGPDDLHPKDARRVLGPTKVIGASVGTVQEARDLYPYVSYLAVGAIFGSSTKGDAGDPVGVQRITEIKNAFPDKKIVAIGGINLSNIASVAAAGADAAAVVSAIVCAEDPAQATRDLLAEFNRGKAMSEALQRHLLRPTSPTKP